MRVTLVATVLFTGIGFAMAPDEPEFERNSLLLRPASLFVLGYMILPAGAELRPCSGGV